MKNTGQTKQRGFTIVEFMIATSVFSVVLLGVTATILRISRSYQHSLYSSSTQAATNNLVDTVAQSIKFSSGQYTEVSSGETVGFCSGNRQFLFVLGRQLGSSDPNTGTRHAVLTRINDLCTVEPLITSTPSGSPNELLGRGMRLSKLDVESPSSGLYKITARVLFGDDDLFCSPTVATSCENFTSNLSRDQMKLDDIRCRPTNGSEFCKVTELSTTVYKRL